MVKCEECGFLAVRNRITGGLDEAPQEYRWRAEIPKFRNPSAWGFQPSGMGMDFYDYPCSGVPICLVRAHPLRNEFTNQDLANEKEIFALLERERDCAERGLFMSWEQGFTPKEHREMMDRNRLLQWQAEQEKANRRYRFLELVLVIITMAVIVWAAFIERSGQPTIINNIIMPTPASQ